MVNLFISNFKCNNKNNIFQQCLKFVPCFYYFKNHLSNSYELSICKHLYWNFGFYYNFTSIKYVLLHLTKLASSNMKLYDKLILNFISKSLDGEFDQILNRSSLYGFWKHLFCKSEAIIHSTRDIMSIHCFLFGISSRVGEWRWYWMSWLLLKPFFYLKPFRSN